MEKARDRAKRDIANPFMNRVGAVMRKDRLSYEEGLIAVLAGDVLEFQERQTIAFERLSAALERMERKVIAV